MSEDEFARLIDDAVGTLRREAGEALPPVAADADAPVVTGYVYESEIAIASPYAMADALQSAVDSDVADDWPDLPEEITFPEEIAFAEVTYSEEVTFAEEIVVVDDFSDAALIAARFAARGEERGEAERPGRKTRGEERGEAERPGRGTRGEERGEAERPGRGTRGEAPGPDPGDRERNRLGEERGGAAAEALARGRDHLLLGAPDVRPQRHAEAFAPAIGKRGPGVGVALIALALLVSVGWHFMEFAAVCRPRAPGPLDAATRAAANIVAAWIVTAESSGDANAKNKRSSATGAGQFLDGTWLDMIRAHRPDLGDKSDAAILELRNDPDLSREMVARFAEGNATMLSRRCLPVTPGTLYLAHFAGGAGAAAVLSASDDADAAATIAEADARGKLTRATIVAANPFLARFTVADLKHWADRKMVAAAGARLSSM